MLSSSEQCHQQLSALSWRAAEQRSTLITCRYSSPIGELQLSADAASLRHISLLNAPHTRSAPRGDPSPLLQQLLERLQCYFSGDTVSFHDLPITLFGTPFQRQVWQHLATLPCGSSTSYSQLAQALGRPKAVRAIGNAVAANPLLILLPCHRALGRHGRLAGYRGGIAAKQYLLTLEGIPFM